MELAVDSPFQVHNVSAGDVGLFSLPFLRGSIIWFPTVEQLNVMSNEDHMRRNIFFALAFMVVTVVTTLMGMAILARPCRPRLHRPRSRIIELPTWRGDDVVRRSVSPGFHMVSGPRRRCCFIKKWSCVGACMGHWALSALACELSVHKGEFSKDVGLNWEFYLMIWTANALWMNVQAIIRVWRCPPSARFSWTAYPFAALSGTAPYISEWFDTLADVVFCYMCTLSRHTIVQRMGLIGIVWLLVLHLYMIEAFNGTEEIFSAYFSVLDVVPMDPRLKELPLSMQFWVLLYGQCSPRKRYFVLMEDLPQAIFRLIYTVYENPDFIFTVLMTLMPVGKILASFCLSGWLSTQIVPYWRRSLASALVCQSKDKLHLVDELLCSDGTGELLLAVLDHDPCKPPQRLHGHVEDESYELIQNLVVNGESNEPLPELARILMLLGNRDESVSVELQNVKLHRSHVSWLVCKAYGHNLQRFSFTRIPLSHTALRALCRLMRSVTEFSLVDCQVDDKGACIISRGVRLSRTMRYLDLSHNPIEAEGCRAIGFSLEESRSVCSLNISYHPGLLRKKYLGRVVKDARLGSLESFHLPGLPQRRNLVPWTQLLQPPSKLATISIVGYFVDPMQAKDIGDMLANNNTLTHLDLSRSGLDDVGIQKLVVHLRGRNTVLKKLYLRYVNCTDHALASLGADKRPHLRYLDLLGNKISQEATIHLGPTTSSSGVVRLTSRVSQFYMGFMTPVEQDAGSQSHCESFKSMTYEEAKFTALHQACYEGNAKLVKKLLGSEASEDLESLTIDGATPLALAARHDELEIVNLLLGAQADPTTVNGKGVTEAIELQHRAVADRLLQAQCAMEVTDTAACVARLAGLGKLPMIDVNERLDDGRTPLFMAVLRESVESVYALLLAGADVNIPSSEFPHMPQELPLTAACRRADGADIVRLLLQARSSASSTSGKHCDALHVAAGHSTVETVQLLLEARADIEALDDMGRSPLFYADTPQIAKCLVENKAKISDDCLFQAAEMPPHGKSHRTLRVFLEAGADPNTRRAGWPLLFFIAANSQLQGQSLARREAQQLEMMKALLHHRVDVNCVADGSEHEGIGGSCIAQAAANERVDMLKLLIAAAAQVDLPSSEKGKTALFIALEKRDPWAASVLLEASADPSVPNDEGTTPLQLLSKESSMTSILGEKLKASYLLCQGSRSVSIR